jgi:Ca2+/Na+ antiporter
MYISRRAKLVWQPIVRDIIFYIIAILLLGYTFHKGGVTILTGILLVSAYIVYVVFVYFWKRIKDYDDNEDEPEKKQISKPFLLDRLAYRHQIVTFFISIGLISLLSWLLVLKAVDISGALGIPELIIGITIVAIGTSVPDLISSVIVTKQGRPGMAINNAIGSNTFDILIGLGLPFLLFALIKGKEMTLDGGNLTVSISILMGSSVILLVYFLLNKWRTSRVIGIFLVLSYILYLAYIICTTNC